MLCTKKFKLVKSMFRLSLFTTCYTHDKRLCSYLMRILRTRFINLTHNIAQLLGCVMWDHVLDKSESPSVHVFPIYGEHSGLCIMEFLTNNYNNLFFIAYSFFVKRPSSSCSVILCKFDISVK